MYRTIQPPPHADHLPSTNPHLLFVAKSILRHIMSLGENYVRSRGCVNL